jgi:hypothetical protein
MGREKDRKLRRKRRRKKKTSKLKRRITQAKTDRERRELIQKLYLISLSKEYFTEL